jgi:PAS domain S-box-containing protein
MIIDVRTMFIATGASCLIVAMALSAIEVGRFRRDGMRQWAFGWACQGAFYALVGLRGTVWDFVSIVIANTCFAASYSLFYAAICIFQGRPYGRGILLFPPAAAFLFFTYFSMYSNTVFPRTIFISALAVVQIGAIIWLLFREASVLERRPYWLTGFAFLLAGLVMLNRLVEALTLPYGQISILASTTFRNTTTMAQLGVAILSSIGFVLMIRGRSERALSDSEQQWATTLASIGDAVIATDVQGRITFMNAVAERLTGWTLAEASTKPVTDVFHIINEGTRSEVESPVAKVLREGMIVGLANHTILVKEDGTELPIDDSGAPIRDRDGKTTGVVLVFRDIGERRLAEEALRESEGKYRTLFANITEEVHFWKLVRDDEGHIKTWRLVDANPPTLTTWGQTLAGIKGKTTDEIFGPGATDHYMPIVQKIMTEGVPYSFEDYFPHLDRYFRFTSIPLGDYFVTTGADITTLKRAEELLKLRVEERTQELRSAYDQLTQETKEREHVEAQLRQAQKMEALGTLTGGIAHDFNNILAAIIGFTEIAKDRTPADSKVQRQLARVFEAGIRGRELVKHMLTFSRQTEQEKKPLPLSSIVKETVKLLRASIPSTVTIKVGVKSESGYVLADPVQMQQVVMNLCANGAYAMREKGGILDVEVSDFNVSPSHENHDDIRPGPYLRLTVRDAGTGISPEIIDRIFDPFFTTKKTGEGTGLGLSVVHGIISQHDGHITVASEPGKGSVFTVYLPNVAEEAPIGAEREDPIPTGHERVLFVDDEEALAEMGHDLLEELGYVVTVKGSSLEALAAVKADPAAYDLVITDQTMPQMTGVDLARAVLLLRADIPIILCTGYSHLVDANQAKAAGIRGFAMKPLTKREIAGTIRQVLDQKV